MTNPLFSTSCDKARSATPCRCGAAASDAQSATRAISGRKCGCIAAAPTTLRSPRVASATVETAGLASDADGSKDRTTVTTCGATTRGTDRVIAPMRRRDATRSLAPEANDSSESRSPTARRSGPKNNAGLRLERRPTSNVAASRALVYSSRRAPMSAAAVIGRARITSSRGSKARITRARSDGDGSVTAMMTSLETMSDTTAREGPATAQMRSGHGPGYAVGGGAATRAPTLATDDAALAADRSVGQMAEIGTPAPGPEANTPPNSRAVEPAAATSDAGAWVVSFIPCRASVGRTEESAGRTAATTAALPALASPGAPLRKL